MSQNVHEELYNKWNLRYLITHFEKGNILID